MRITGGLGGLTPLTKTWTPPKEVKTTGRGGVDTRPGEEVDPLDCHCIIRTMARGKLRVRGKGEG